jgi:queuine tRNA-ribosyltransferase
MAETGEAFSFQVSARDGAARLGAISTPRGTIRTPAFMPCGTAATVKAMYPEQVRALGTDVLLGNTYHLMLAPGAERIARLGGLHKFRRVPGDEPRQAAQARRARRRFPIACRRLAP